MKKILIATLALLFVSQTLIYGQVSTAMRAEKKDSAHATRYPYIMPILGHKVASKGFQLPYPFGIMVNTFVGVQELKLSDLKVGFNNLGLIGLDSIVTIDQFKANAITVNARLDSWIFPFWDFYLMGGYGFANNDLSITEPFLINTSTSSQGYYFGLGSTIAFGIRHLFASADVNYLWNYQNLLNKPAQVLTAGVRAGPVFRFPQHKQMNLVIWCGGLYTNLNSETAGEIALGDVFPEAGAAIDDIQTQVDDWYNGLSPAKQQLFAETYGRIKDGLDNVSNNIPTSTIQYEMQKKIEHPFNLIIGGQYQINLRWQLRGETQFLGDRVGGLISVNYRFGIRGKNMFSGQN